MSATLQNGTASPAPTVSLSSDEIDDLLYIARANDLKELDPFLDTLCTKYNASKAAILSSAIDAESGNTMLHYAGANGLNGTSVPTLMPVLKGI